MARVTGIGGVFLKCKGDSAALAAWYRTHLGMPLETWGGAVLRWPDDTRIYCAHEYTLSNAAFALTVEPENPALVARAREVAALRRAGQPTVPSTLGVEKATNPFLRPMSPGLQATIGLAGADAVTVFARTRALKDRFRG